MGRKLSKEKPSPRLQELTYSKYLKVSELTSLQEPLSEPLAHDEMLFIIIHQTYELWFKQVLFELDALVAALLTEDLMKSFRIMDRVCEIFRVLIQQVDILETMTPVDFNLFRSNLNPASGFQSAQFRELEIIAGANPADYEKFFKLEPEWKNKLKHRIAKPTLRDAFVALLTKKKWGPSKKPLPLKEAIQKVYHEPEHIALHNLCEYLIGFDEQLTLWRFRHVQMVERMIGMKPGTGGSLGVSYLQQTLKKRFFPELWEARTEMNSELTY